MKAAHIILALGLTVGLSACGGPDIASRNGPLNTDLPFASTSSTSTQSVTLARQKRIVLASQYNVTEIRIDVPKSLSVSEANMFYPNAKIVWRGEPLGDRHTQVHSIFTDAFGMGTAHMKSGPAVIVEATVKRFHGVTEKTRYTFGGVFNMEFDLTVRDAATGAVLDGPRFVEIDVKAAGGSAAIAEEQAGRTQRVVVIEALREGIRRELSRQVQEVPMSRNTAPNGLAPGQMIVVPAAKL